MTGSGIEMAALQRAALDGVPVKTSDLADRVKAGGIGAIGGETDAEVSFAVTVR